MQVDPLQPSPVRTYVDAMPSIRSQRKRSASSSPPLRPRILLPSASLPSIPTQSQHQPPVLTLSTSMSDAQMQSYSSTAPLSAPALSREPTLIVDQPSPSDYYHYDNGSAVWYDNGSGSSPNTAVGSDYGYSNTQTWEPQPHLVCPFPRLYLFRKTSIFIKAIITFHFRTSLRSLSTRRRRLRHPRPS